MYRFGYLITGRTADHRQVMKSFNSAGKSKVGLRGFEPPRPLRTLEPESSASASSATGPNSYSSTAYDDPPRRQLHLALPSALVPQSAGMSASVQCLPFFARRTEVNPFFQIPSRRPPRGNHHIHAADVTETLKKRRVGLIEGIASSVTTSTSRQDYD